MIVGGDIVKTDEKARLHPGQEFIVFFRWDSMNGPMLRVSLRKDDYLKHEYGSCLVDVIEKEVTITGRASEEEFEIYRQKMNRPPIGCGLWDESLKEDYQRTQYGK